MSLVKNVDVAGHSVRTYIYLDMHIALDYRLTGNR